MNDKRARIEARARRRNGPSSAVLENIAAANAKAIWRGRNRYTGEVVEGTPSEVAAKARGEAR